MENQHGVCAYFLFSPFKCLILQFACILNRNFWLHLVVACCVFEFYTLTNLTGLDVKVKHEDFLNLNPEDPCYSKVIFIVFNHLYKFS